jgi:hypothetical protein
MLKPFYIIHLFRQGNQTRHRSYEQDYDLEAHAAFFRRRGIVRNTPCHACLGEMERGARDALYIFCLGHRKEAL